MISGKSDSDEMIADSNDCLLSSLFRAAHLRHTGSANHRTANREPKGVLLFEVYVLPKVKLAVRLFTHCV